MDALGTDCFSETCPVLKLQLGELAINCTQPQQAKEDIGSDTCTLWFVFVARDILLTSPLIRAHGTPGWYAGRIGYDNGETKRVGFLMPIARQLPNNLGVEIN